MAGHQLIDDYLADLAGRLPADAVDELADGVVETFEHHVAAGFTLAGAARATIAEFGSTERISRAFVAQAPGRRVARLLLATGPLVGACWGASLVTAHAWTWGIPRSVAFAFALVLLVIVASLATAVASRRSYRLTRLGAIGGLALIALDAAMLAAALVIAPALVWPMAAAIPASLARMGFTIAALARALPA